MKSVLVFALFTAACATAPPTITSADPCTLITSTEAEKVEGEAIRETTPSRAEKGEIVWEQCFYALPTFAKSFTVTAVFPRSGSGSELRRHWRNLFAKRDEREEEKEEREREREKGNVVSSADRRVEGVGRDARWSISRYGGVLHVLGDRAVVRITVGSTGDEADRLRRARALADVVLARLSGVP